MMAKMVSKYILVGNCINDQKIWSEDFLAKSDRLTMVWIKWNLLQLFVSLTNKIIAVVKICTNALDIALCTPTLLLKQLVNCALTLCVFAVAYM